MNEAMNPILQTVADFLKSKQFHYGTRDDGEALCLPCVGQKLVWSMRSSSTVDRQPSTLNP
jgi:hypothetical protein